MKAERVVGCYHCGKPALLAGDTFPAEPPRCFWCMAADRPGAFAAFEAEHVPALVAAIERHAKAASEWQERAERAEAELVRGKR